MKSPTGREFPQSWANQDARSPWQAESGSLGGLSGVQAPLFLCGLDSLLPFSVPQFPSLRRGVGPGGVWGDHSGLRLQGVLALADLEAASALPPAWV